MSLATIGANRIVAFLAGLFVLLGGLVLAGWLYLQVVQPGQRAGYFVLLPDVSGLRPGTEVRVSGYSVGEISDISPELDNIDEIEFRVDFVVDKLWPIPVDSTVSIAKDDLLSSPVLNLTPGKTANLLSEGGRLLTVAAPSGLGERALRLLNNEIPRSLESFIATLEAVQVQLDDNVPGILYDVRYVLSKTADTLAKLEPQLDKLAVGLGGAGSMMQELSGEENTRQVKAILANLNRVSGNLAAASSQLRDVMDSSVALLTASQSIVVENGGTLRNTLQDSEFAMQSVASSINLVLQNLQRTSQDLAGLMAEIRADPTILLRGNAGEDGVPFE